MIAFKKIQHFFKNHPIFSHPLVIKLFKFAVSLSLVTFLCSQINFSKFLNTLERANIFLVIIAALLAYLGVYLSILKWSSFLKNFSMKVRSLKLYSLYSIAGFFNNFLPSTVGGDSYRYVYLSKYFPESKKEVAASIVLERFTGFVVLFLLNLTLLPIYSGTIMQNKPLLILEICIAVGFLAMIVSAKFFHKRRSILLDKFSFTRRIQSLFTSLYDVKSAYTFVWGLFLSVLFAADIVLARWILLYAFGLNISPGYLLFTSTIVQIVSILPISLNSIGIAEGLSVYLYSLVGISPEISLAVALVARVSQIITSAVGGLFYFFNKKIAD